MIGELLPSEWRTFTDADTGRTVVQLTGADAHSYPLYYFTPSVTSDGRYLVLHSERSGSVQLYRLDLTTGALGQLTDGRTEDSGWAVWCERHVTGIFNHLSALGPRGEAYYFQEREIRATSVQTFENRVVALLPYGQMPIGQSAVSPDGTLLAFIHADADRYVELLGRREAALDLGVFDWRTQHHTWFRNAVGTTLSVVEVDTGELRTVISTDFHVHHVQFADDCTLLVNHPKGHPGLWLVGTDGSGVRELRPPEVAGAHGAAIVHQVVTQQGIVYEAVADEADGSAATYLGIYDLRTDSFAERRLPLTGYVHVGHDPAGRFAFVEHASRDGHELLAVRPVGRMADADVEVLRRLASPAHDDQRNHAHPFLSSDRAWMYFTDWSSGGFSQVFGLQVGDLTDR